MSGGYLVIWTDWQKQRGWITFGWRRWTADACISLTRDSDDRMTSAGYCLDNEAAK